MLRRRIDDLFTLEKVVPLVFDTYGGYADETIRSLETTVMGMSKNDDVLAANLSGTSVIEL